MALSSAHRGGAAALARRSAAAYRRTGADLPWSDPRPSHGTEMEGWFWRITDASRGRVVVALCGINHHPDGDWATVAVALHPGGVVHRAVLDDAQASDAELQIRAGTSPDRVFEASASRLHVALDGVKVDVQFSRSFAWPKATGGGGVFSVVPFLNQYWHPHGLGGDASGTIAVGDERWQLEAAPVYAERNWGAGFPQRWWWGQAHDFPGDDLSVVFTGGVLRLGPLAQTVGGVVVRHREQVIRITPPALVRSAISPNRWRIRARSLRYQIDLDGDGTGLEPHVLPVPLPAERRNVDTDFEHLAGRLRCVVRDRNHAIIDATSALAGLEIGSLPGIDPYNMDRGRRFRRQPYGRTRSGGPAL